MLKKILLTLFLVSLISPVFATVPAAETKRQYFTCNGSITTFTFTSPCNSSDDIKVYKRLISTGAETLLTEDIDYTIAYTGSSYLEGGVVTINPALASTYQVVIVREIVQTQETASGAITPISVVASLDKLTREIQDIRYDLTYRYLRIPQTDIDTLDMEIPNSISRAGRNATWDSDGNPTATSQLSTGLANISAWGETFIDDGDAPEARGTLGLDTDDDVEFAAITGTTGTFTDLITKGPWFDVRIYGAGTSESASTNATAIQAAIDAAELVGGIVFSPPGTYLIDTQLDITNTMSFIAPGMIIKQDDSKDITTVLSIIPGSAKDVYIRIKVDGNMANNTAVNGILISGPSTGYANIQVAAMNCDNGIVIEGNTESNVIFTYTTGCTVGVLERGGVFTPDENTIFISSHNNATHYKKESTAHTSVLHFSCEQSTAYAVIIDGGTTILNGEIRGCQDTGVDVISGEAIFNNLKLVGLDVGWAVQVTDSDNIFGSFDSINFDGGVWIKKCETGSLCINARSCFSKPIVKLGDKAGENTQARRFTIMPGSSGFSETGPTVEFDYSLNCDVNLNGVTAGAGNNVLFGADSDYDILRIPATRNDITVSVNASAISPAIETYGHSAPPSFADVDATPSILMGNVFLSGTAAETITDFTDKAAQKEFTVISKAAITYDTTGTNLVGSSADIVTATGDTTFWICEDDTTVRLKGFVDVSADNSGGI